MANLSLTMGCMPYDRTEAMRCGIVQPEGIDLTWPIMEDVAQIFGPMVERQAFDVAEMSLSLYMIFKARGDFPFVAPPIFPSRLFRHAYMWVNTDSQIRTPKDLEGKRMGLPLYRQIASVWMKGILHREYGVGIETIHWFEGGYNAPSKGLSSVKPEGRPIRVDTIREDQALNQMLDRGELDALMGARKPDCFGVNPHIQRLFPNYRELEPEFYRKTGIFPIMHTLVIKESIYQEHPWVAESLFKAFEESQRWCLAQMRSNQGGTLRYMLPWMPEALQEMDELFGPNPWPHGMEPNRHTLETAVGHLVDQGLMPEPVPVDDLFVPVGA